MSSENGKGSGDLYIARFVVRPRPLYEFANATGILRRAWGTEDRADMGYILHGALAASFGSDAPKPFYSMSSQEIRAIASPMFPVEKQFVVLAYTDSPPEALQDQASSAAGLAAGIIDWNLTAFKRMPTEFPVGRQLAFTTRVCPVVRSSVVARVGARANTETEFRTSNSRTHLKDRSSEVDAFIAACALAERDSTEKPVRFDVYRQWLLTKIASGGVDVESIDVTGFQLCDVTRRNRDRKLVASQRPVAELKGILRITDPDRFAIMLHRGIGRHLSFGFGMIRLAPV